MGGREAECCDGWGLDREIREEGGKMESRAYVVHDLIRSCSGRFEIGSGPGQDLDLGMWSELELLCGT